MSERRELPEEAYGAALAGLQAVAPKRLLALVQSAPSLARVWSALVRRRPKDDPALGRLSAERPALVGRWEDEARQIDVEALWARCAGQRVFLFGRPDYPECLLGDPLPPAVLFALGDPAALEHRAVAIVGTRHATVGGMEFASQLGHDLAANGITVVSGLAKGIDGAAHRGALAAAGGAPPVGVVGSGLDTIYPRSNAGLWADVAERGLLCAEVPAGTRPAAHRFPARNRIIAGLAELVVVVESRVRGGSLLTVTEAQQRGVTVMAVPGSVRSPASEGTNLLLIDGVPPVVDAIDVLVVLGLESRPKDRGRRERRPPPDLADRPLLDLLGGDALSVDSLVLRSGRPLPDVAVALGRLEAAGWVSRTGAWFEQVPRGRA